MKEMIMTTQQSNALTAEVLPQQVSRRRLALGRGLGELLLHTQLRRAGHRARALREEPLPRGMPSWARGFYHKVCRLGRKV
jgi:hypothetical protein